MLKPAYEVNYNILKLSSVVEICNSGKSNLKVSYFSVEFLVLMLIYLFSEGE